ncbi:MAG: GTP cyclohydrolase I FolE [Alphaproteobacteria bacterium]|nr:GTP cyclohydrolase I FolE [Alphaproteobacteria bacterium]
MTASPTKKEAEQAVRTLIAWAGDNPDREGLRETPDRVTRAFAEYFSGYGIDPSDYLQKTFEEASGYDEIVLLRDIRFESFCEHHMAPMVGVAHVAYLPDKRIVGISKLARVVDLFAKRLQIQEKLTAEIADTIDSVLRPLGVAVVIEAVHSCMTTRGVHKAGATMITSRVTGVLKTDPQLRQEVLNMIRNNTGGCRFV